MKASILLASVAFSTSLVAQSDDALLAEMSSSKKAEHSVLSQFDRAVAASPTSAAAWYDRAEARYAKGDNEGALKDLDHVSKLEPYDTYAILLRADILSAAGKDQMATNELHRILGLDPKGPVAEEALMELGRIALHQNELPKALVHFNRLLDLAPYNAVAWCERGKAYAALLDDENAIADMQKALDLDPSLDQAYANLAAVYFRQGRKLEGCFALHQAHDLGDLSVERLLLVHCE